MQAKDFINKLNSFGINYYSGVPDSLLNALCLQLISCSDKNIRVEIGVNEGNSLALASGNYMATGNTPCVFMQNSGLGNIVNPYTSLSHKRVYGVPVLFVIGWRGEKGVKDEPQHVFMGDITLKLLDLLEIKYKIIDEDTTLAEVEEALTDFSACFNNKQSCAFVVRKGTFLGSGNATSPKNYKIIRENAIEHIVKSIGTDDIVVSSTGKISRELFEVRERLNMPHSTDFLTVGSMGFASSVAAEIAYLKPNKNVICIDGDGAALMHLGCMATIASLNLNNFCHIILDNELHESVGGVPTVSGKIDYIHLAKALGYKSAKIITSLDDLNNCKTFSGGSLLVIKVSGFSRSDLGRPTTSAKENIDNFISYLKQ